MLHKKRTQLCNRRYNNRSLITKSIDTKNPAHPSVPDGTFGRAVPRTQYPVPKKQKSSISPPKGIPSGKGVLRTYFFEDPLPKAFLWKKINAIRQLANANFRDRQSTVGNPQSSVKPEQETRNQFSRTELYLAGKSIEQKKHGCCPV